MRAFFLSDSCKESQLNAINPQSWLQVERGKLSKLSSSYSTNSSSIESFIKVPEPPIVPFFRPVDYVDVLAQIHEELESCSVQECTDLYLLQFQIFRGLGEAKLMRRSLRSAWQKGDPTLTRMANEDYKAAIRDVQVILTLSPEYRMFEGRVAATQLRTLVHEHVDNWTTADCWMQLYDRWSTVDDIGSLSIIYQMLESGEAKSVLYFRQSLLLLRLNCPDAAMRSLELAYQHASSEHERLVYEGWILYDAGHCEEGLRKAEESIRIKRSFEAFFLKAYALADSSMYLSCSPTVISLLESALRCPSDNLRKGQKRQGCSVRGND